ncbi:cytochrome-450 hydroxylase [Pholiota conissans]|uniref:Cytochrome-450 hydroxylase n=1 Tax=Pholiota conissans TaxID=109636 RepID=A0A9P6CTP5_9AGAR|nr:cytochrome-450 hydroxylase [Pholiota conissans]
MFVPILLAALAAVFAYLIYLVLIAPKFNALQKIAGPPAVGLFKNHLYHVLDPKVSPQVHEFYVQKYGRSIRVQGVGPWDIRLLTLDPVSVAHVLKNSTIYEKPWQSRRLITSLIGCGMLAAEGQVHKRQRRVATPAFSIQNLRGLVPLVFNKGNELKDKWLKMIEASPEPLTIDVCHWVSRATFDVIGLAGFDYSFNAIENESNELFCAYKEMFEVAISQSNPMRTIFRIYMPFISSLLPDETLRTVYRCHKVIHRVAGHLIQEKKAKIEQGLKSGVPYAGKDLLSLLLKSNVATDLPEDQRISDEDILNNINTFMFAGSDTSSLSLTWTLLLLAQNPAMQDRLRAELFSVYSPSSSGTLADLTEDEIHSLHSAISNLPYLHNVVRECIRLIPPVHSSIRVATEDDEIPTSSPVYGRDGRPTEKRSVTVPKGSFVHVAVEGFNLDKSFWGEDAWEFQPDRWDNLPDKASQLPGLFSNTLTFSAGPRSCIGLRFSMIEIKTFLYILLTNCVFKPTEDKIQRANVVLTRPYIAGKFKDGSRCPIIVLPYKRKQVN